MTLIAGGEWYVHQARKTFAEIVRDPREMAAVFVKAHERLGHDLIWTGAGFLNYPAHLLGCPIEDRSSDTPRLLGPAIPAVGKVDRLAPDQALGHPLMGRLTEAHHLVADAIGRDAMILPTQWGPLTTAARIAGTDAVMMATLEDPDGLGRLLSVCTEFLWGMVEPILDHPDIAGVNFSDPVASGDLISPQTFRTVAKPHLQALCHRVKARGKHCSMHICGDTGRILGDVLEMAPDCFSLESKVDLGLARRVLGGKVCVAGNVSPTGAFLSGTPQEVEAEARDCVRAWGDAGGFVLTVGCDFPKSVPLENALALMSLKDRPAAG